MLNIVCKVFNLQLLLWSPRYHRPRSSPIASLRGPVTINRRGSWAAGDNANALVGSNQSLIWDIYSFLKERLHPRGDPSKREAVKWTRLMICLKTWPEESQPWSWCGDLWFSISHVAWQDVWVLLFFVIFLSSLPFSHCKFTMWTSTIAPTMNFVWIFSVSTFAMQFFTKQKWYFWNFMSAGVPIAWQEAYKLWFWSSETPFKREWRHKIFSDKSAFFHVVCCQEWLIYFFCLMTI